MLAGTWELRPDSANPKTQDQHSFQFAVHFHTGKFQWALSPALSRSRRERRPYW
jgi:hypothetical protein